MSLGVGDYLLGAKLRMTTMDRGFLQVTGNPGKGLVGKPEDCGDSETDPECGLTAAK